MKFGLGATDLTRIIATAPARYKVFTIPKRNGGVRTIAQPAREVKALQRYVLQHILVKMPVHPAAMGYVAGKNIADNAYAHVGSRVILKLDFENFFPSISVRDWEFYARFYRPKIDPSDVAIFSRILFWGMRTSTPVCLSIGAPTSPSLSNILLFKIDTALSHIAAKAGVIYTRYADDITASAMQIEELSMFEQAARALVRQTRSPRLVFNDEKRGVYTMGQRRMVTGLVLTPDQNVSIGRARKRQISAMLHRLSVGKIDAEGIASLKGLLGFAIANEPDFVTRMREKYGNDTIDFALKYKIPGKDQVHRSSNNKDVDEPW